MKVATNLLLASLLAFYFPAGFCVVSFASLGGTARNNEIHSLKQKDLSNLDESICHNARGEKIPEKVINDEPIRPGINREEKKKGRKSRKIKVVLTGYYTPEPNQPWYLNGSFAREKAVNGKGKLTATGTVPKKNWTIAANPKFLPPKTEIRIDGFEGVFKVGDTGGKIKGKKLDFYTGRGFLALQEALKLPRKVVIEIL